MDKIVILDSMVEKLAKMKDGDRTCVTALLNDLYVFQRQERDIFIYKDFAITGKEMFELTDALPHAARKKGIKLVDPYGPGAAIGLPFNIDFIKQSI